jgi:hypothetical protein
MNRFERRIRNLINPYSTAFARWWCHSGRYLIPGNRAITGNRAAARSRLRGPAMPGPNRGISGAASGRSAADFWIAAQAARRAAVDELLASANDGDGKDA